MDSQTIAKIIAFILYLGFMVYIGVRSSRKTNNAKDFFLGGRGIGPWVTALSAEASDSSAWLLIKSICSTLSVKLFKSFV